jgi:1-acyl-sn-glycerol-3-phosphate acyltransferase
MSQPRTEPPPPSAPGRASVKVPPKSALARAFGAWSSRWGRDVSAYDPQAVLDTLAVFDRLAALLPPLFPLDVHGLERIPPSPALIVSNHSGGDMAIDAWGFVLTWYRRFGVQRPLHGLAHELVVGQPLTGPFFARRGVLAADPGLAKEVLLDARRDLMVMPGGGEETWRPYRDRYRVCFNGRRGYAKLALETGVPIVPVAHAGAHETLLVLSTGRRLARLLNIVRIGRAEIFPLHVSLPWGLAVGPFMHVPWPVRLSYWIGEPVRLPGVEGPLPSPPPELVDALDRRVRASIQEGLDVLRGLRLGRRRGAG